MENIEEKIKEKVEELKQKKIPFLILENVNSDDGIFAMKKDFIEKSKNIFRIFLIISVGIFVFGIILTLTISNFITNDSFVMTSVTILILLSCILYLLKYFLVLIFSVKSSIHKIFLINIGQYLIFFQNGAIIGDKIYLFGNDESFKGFGKSLKIFYDTFGRNYFLEDLELKKIIGNKLEKDIFRKNGYIRSKILSFSSDGFFLMFVFGAFICFLLFHLFNFSTFLSINYGKVYGFGFSFLILFLIIFLSLDLQKFFYKHSQKLIELIISTHFRINGNKIYFLRKNLIDFYSILQKVIFSGEEFRQTIKTFYNGDISNISSDLSKNIQTLHKNISLAIISKSKLEKEIGNDEKLNEIIDLPKIKEFLKFQFNNPINLLIVFLVKYGKENEKMLSEVQKLNLKDKEIILQNNIKTIKETLEKLKSLNI